MKYVRKKIIDFLFFLFLMGLIIISVGILAYNFLFLSFHLRIFLEYSLLLIIAGLGLYLWNRER